MYANGAPLQSNHPHHQQPGQGQPQPMMYNNAPQQFAGSHPPPYGTAGPGMGMGPNAGMMQQNGMAQMAGPNVGSYQTPYTGSPYGSMPSASHIPQNFMPTSNAPQFQMNATNMSMNMSPQQMQQMQHMQRMMPPHQSSTPTQPGPRPSPFAGSPHNNSNSNNSMPQSQFPPPPQNANQPQMQTPNSNGQPGQPQSATVITPQTPNFPQGAQSAGGAGNMATPLSPGSEAKEKDRVTLLLEINRELLLEVMHIQTLQTESKKDVTSPTAASPDGGDKEKADKTKLHSREYVECMRRLQANLAYLAAIADRSHKPSSQIPPHPAFLTAPPLTAKPLVKSTSSANSPSTESKKDEKADEVKLEGEGQEERIETLKHQYKRLQELFPGVDLKKEAPLPNTNPAAAARAQQQAQLQKQQGQGQGSPSQNQLGDPNGQQKMQNDMLRQRMMAQAQAQSQALAQGQSQAQLQSNQPQTQ